MSMMGILLHFVAHVFNFLQPKLQTSIDAGASLTRKRKMCKNLKQRFESTSGSLLITALLWYVC